MKASDNPFPDILVEEVATDGSATGTPSADFRRLFLGEDGALHLKDSSGTVTAIGAGGAVASDAIWDAKGDIAVGTAANAAARLAVGGTNGHVLTVDSGEATGLKWAAVAASGGLTIPVPVQVASHTSNQDQNPTITIGSAISGNMLVLGAFPIRRAVTSVACTNVTWTKVHSDMYNDVYAEIWIGIVSGGNSGATITISTSSADWVNAQVMELSDAVPAGTPTNASSAVAQDAAISVSTLLKAGPVTASAGTLVVAATADKRRHGPDGDDPRRARRRAR